MANVRLIICIFALFQFCFRLFFWGFFSQFFWLFNGWLVGSLMILTLASKG